MRISKLWLLATSSVLALNGVAFAAEEQAGNVEEVVVTGSRIIREGFEAPTPLTVVSAEQIQTAAGSNLAEFVNTMPAFSGSTTPQNTSSQLSLGNSGTSQLNLRRLGVLRTLILLDGQRSVGSTFDNAVDVNTFPQALVSRVDVVTGGASAVYGSDAVAGVVNFVLDKEFTGLKGEVSGGMTKYGDGENYRLMVAGGMPFAGGRGHVLASAEHVDKAAIHDFDSRPWARRNQSNLRNPNYTATNGQPQFIVQPNVSFQNASPGGHITAGPLKGIAFGPGGSMYPFQYGSVIDGNLMSGGQFNANWTAPKVGNSLDIAESRQSLFLRAQYDVTDNFTIFAQAQYAKSATLARVVPYQRPGTITVKDDNAYIPAALRTQMTALGVTSFAFGTQNADLPSAGSDYDRALNRYVIGGNGKFDLFGNDWTYNFSWAYGQVRNSIDSPNLTNAVRYNLAIDAVTNPATGQIVCRSTLTNPTNGCTPYNLFGTGVNGQQVIDYLQGSAHMSHRNIQNVQEATVTGPLFDNWAGPVAAAFSVSHRTEESRGVADPVSGRVPVEWFSSSFSPTNAKYSVTEGAVEVDIPLARDTSWAESLDTNVAARFTEYSNSGFVTTWKVGAAYQPIPDIRIRANQSRDIRAPVLLELYLPVVGSGINAILDPFTNTRPTPLSPQGGNPNLKPEKADTTEIGVILQPRFVDGLSFSADYWRIKIKDAITVLGVQQIVDVCFQLGQNCNSITRVNGVITQVDRYSLNLATQDLRGLDFEASYRFAGSDIISSLPGDFTFHANFTKYLKNYSVSAVTQAIDDVGGQGLPHYSYNASVSWNSDPINITLIGRGISSGVYSVTNIECTTGCPASTTLNPTINDNQLGGAFYLDSAVNYKLDLTDSISGDLFFNVRNILDKYPPYSFGGSIDRTIPASSTNFDIVGRTYRAGLRFRY